MKFHIPVLLKEVLEYLNVEPGDIVVDGTLGGGGHALEIVKKILPNGKLVGIDQDEAALIHARKVFKKNHISKNTILVHNNFSHLKDILEQIGIQKVNGILLDLGVSSFQINHAERGFTFQKNEILNMQLFSGERAKEEGKNITAYDVVNSYSKQKLKEVLKQNADIIRPGIIASRIVRARRSSPIDSTVKLVTAVCGASFQNKNEALNKPQTKLLAKVWQAIRIEVNKELQQLDSVLPQIVDVLAPTGRVVIISYHSQEDRRVKTFFKKETQTCICPKELPVCRCNTQPRLKILTKKIITPGEKEVHRNPRSRSAKMRVAMKL